MIIKPNQDGTVTVSQAWWRTGVKHSRQFTSSQDDIKEAYLWAREASMGWADEQDEEFKQVIGRHAV